MYPYVHTCTINTLWYVQVQGHNRMGRKPLKYLVRRLYSLRERVVTKPSLFLVNIKLRGWLSLSQLVRSVNGFSPLRQQGKFPRNHNHSWHIIPAYNLGISGRITLFYSLSKLILLMNYNFSLWKNLIFNWINYVTS